MYLEARDLSGGEGIENAAGHLLSPRGRGTSRHLASLTDLRGERSPDLGEQRWIETNISNGRATKLSRARAILPRRHCTCV